MENRDKATSSARGWRNVALIARRVQAETVKAGEEGEREKRPVKKPQQNTPRKSMSVWADRRRINKNAVQAAVAGDITHSHLSRAEAILVAQQLAAVGFEPEHTAQWLGVSWRTIYRLLADGRKQDNKR